MKLIVAQMKWIMLVAGALTCTLIYAAVSPQEAIRSTFGDLVLLSPALEIIVRNWAILITMVGGLVIYGAFNPASRPLVLVFAGISKVIFLGLVFTYGKNIFEHQIGIGVVADLLILAVFAAYLFGTMGKPGKKKKR